MADVRPRSGRHALFPADTDHARECRPAQGSVGVSHAACWCDRACADGLRRGPEGEATSASTGRRRTRAGRTRRVGISRERSDAAGDRRNDVSVHAVLSRGGGGAGTGKEIWAFSLPSGGASTRGVEYWPGDAQTAPQVVFGSCDGKLYSLNAKTGKPNEAFGDNGIVNLNTPEIMQGLPGRNGLSFAADRVQEPGDHGRHDAGESAEGSRGRCARVEHAHGQAGVDLPFDSARRREVQRHVGAARVGRIARA